jgi:mRNA interferase HigB
LPKSSDELPTGTIYAALPKAHDVRKTYPHADAVGEFTIFNISGNKYRLAPYINYRAGKVYIRHVMTHEESSREDWKKR